MAERVKTTKALKKLDSQLECSLCLDNFTQPKLLPCYHVFCKLCLERLVTKDGTSLTCPTCRNVVQLSERGVAGLQSDFHMDSLFEIQDAFNKAEDNNDAKICGNCDNGKAFSYCSNCEEFLCEECQTGHKKYSKKHKILSLEDWESQTSSLVSSTKATPTCPQHPANPLKIHCATCSTFICIDCTIRLHKDHNYDLVADVLTQHKEELVSSLKPVKEKLVTVQQALKEFDERVKAIHDQRATIEADIHREIDAQRALLDQRQAELLRELDMLTQQKLKSLAAQKDFVQVTETKLNSCMEYAEGGIEAGTENEALEITASVLQRVEKISDEFDSSAIPPETMADMKIVPTGKERLQQAYKAFLSIDHGSLFSSENSKTTGDGLVCASKGETKTVYFEPKNKIKKDFEGEIDMKAKLMHSKSNKKFVCDVNVRNGRHEISYRPVYRGKHELHISVNEAPVRGSPFPITVTSLPEPKPVKVVQGLNYPRSVAVNSKGQMIVVDSDGSSVSVLTADGQKILSFSQMSNVYGVTIDKDDNIYVVEINNRRIRKFSAEGMLLATVGSKGSGKLQFDYPVGICYNPVNNALYVNDNCNHRMHVLTTDLKFVQCFGSRGTENGKFQYPHFAAFNSANNLYVTDNENHRVQVFTADGRFLKAFSQKTYGKKLNRPWAIAIDSNDTVYVSEKDPNCISVFTSQGEYLKTIGGYGSQEGQFNHPWGLSIDHNDCVIVSDYNNSRLQVF